MRLKRFIFLIVIFTFTNYNKANSQDQKKTDSLVSIYESGDYDNEFEILKTITRNETNPDSKLKYAELLIANALNDTSIDNLQYAHSSKADALQLKGDFVEALDYYLQSMVYVKQLNDIKLEGIANISIANTYSMIGNSDNAELYYKEGIALLRKTADSVALASALLNFGDECFNTEKYDEALLYFEESGVIFEKINYHIGKAYNLGNVGMVYAEQGKDELAMENINQAITMLQELEDYYAISVYLTYMADIYAKQNNYSKAFEYAQRSLDLALSKGLKDQISGAHLKLSELYEKASDMENSYKHYKDYIIYRDSLNNIENVEKMANLRTDYEVSQKQAEVDLLTQKRKTQRIIVYATLLALFLIGLLALGLFKRNKYVRATNKIIEAEKQRSDNLLLNILPEETAQELKDNGRVEAKRFESVTVLFTDFKGFTHYAEHLSPEKLVATIDFYFSKFDAIIEKYDLEKIKTVGDAYMCAGGLPFPTEDHATKMVMAAKEIIEFVHNEKNNAQDSETRFDIRVGINTGPVVAGVVGSKKFAYDIWGDTVNIASRMESCSEPGKINISEHTYLLVKDKFNCNFRGNIEVKNRGQLKMYFVDGLITTT